MDKLAKLRLLSSASKTEAGEDGCRLQSKKRPDGIILTHAVLPNGKTTTLLKSLLTSVCENNCLYCPMRSGRDFRRTTFKPEDFAQLVVNLTKAGLIQGVFLSSGVAGGGIRTQDKLIQTADILRRRLGYRAYIHLKIMPGAQFEQIMASMRLADRVSINLEAPNAARLPSIAPKKDFERELMKPIRLFNHIRKNYSAAAAWKNRWPSACTQFVVGGADETDKELLSTSQSLHRDHHLLRIYYSALTPHAGTPFAQHAPVPKRREQRLYQADYLMRDYGFSESEFSYDTEGQLPLEKDPKLMWAERNIMHKPVEVNLASREELLRVPGIGPKGALAVIRARKECKLSNLSSLRKIGIQTQRAKDFILMNDRRPSRQPVLF
jgi:predicted DNA-binding helix-hairpin-helix protein